MNAAARMSLFAVLAASACAPVVEVRTDPIDQTIPVTSLGVQTFVELAIPLPPQSQGDVEVNDVFADLAVLNPSRGTSMLVELRVSLTGTATPEVPYAFTQANKPDYFNNSVAILGPKTYAGGTSTPEHVHGAALIPAIGEPMLWLIVSNTVNNLALGDVLPLQVELSDIVVQAVVTKSLAGLGGGLEATGL